MITRIKRYLGLIALAFVIALLPTLETPTLPFYLGCVTLIIVAGATMILIVDANELLCDDDSQGVIMPDLFVRQPDDGYMYVDSDGQPV